MKQKNSKKNNKFLAFATLPFFIFIILFFLAIINNIYTKNESMIDKLQAFQASIKRAELEETIRKASEDVVSAYKEIKNIKPELVKADEQAGWPVLKTIMLLNIKQASTNYLQIKSKINTTCFCSFYDYNALKSSVEAASNETTLTIPRDAQHVGNCESHIDIFIASLDNISIILSKNGTMFFCMVQHRNTAYIEPLTQEIKLRQTTPERNEILNLILDELENKYT